MNNAIVSRFGNEDIWHALGAIAYHCRVILLAIHGIVSTHLGNMAA